MTTATYISITLSHRHTIRPPILLQEMMSKNSFKAFPAVIIFRGQTTSLGEKFFSMYVITYRHF